MTISVNPDQEKIIQEHIVSGRYRSVEHVLDSALMNLPADDQRNDSLRRSAIERMLAFGKRHRLSLDEPITRDLFNDEHRD